MESQLSDTVLSIRDILSHNLRNLQENTAIGFSGGLDSTVLMAASDLSPKAYTVGVAGCTDFSNSRSASSMLGFHIEEIILSDSQILQYARLLRELDPEIENGEIGYEVVLATLLDNITEDTLITGQGADEIFYGYRRFIDDPSLTNKAHMEKLFKRTLPRESKLAEYFDKKLVTPYLSEEMLEATKLLKRGDNISAGTNKIVLREVAALLGIPAEIVGRDKKAAQYGSGVNRIILRSIRRNRA